MAVVALVCLVIFLYLCYVYLRPNSKGKLPDGPKGIPILGNALQLSKEKSLMDISDIGMRYGDAFTLNLFGVKMVVLNSFDIIKEAFTAPKYAVTFSGRPENFSSKYVFPEDVGLATYSEKWSALRKLVFKGLKTYGSNMAEVEDLVQGEIKYLIERIEKEDGKPVDPYNYIRGYVTSVISMLVTGRHLKQDDEQLMLINNVVDQMALFFDTNVQMIFTFLPWVRFLPFGPGRVFQKMKRDIFIMKESIEHGRQKPPEESDRNPCFLDFMHQEKEKGNVTEENIDGVMLNMLAAGTSTSQTTLYSLFLMLTARLDIQKRIQEEIDDVVGWGRLPCSGDKNAMPYSQAVLWETLRYYPTDPVTVPRCTMEDVSIKDYIFPKDTQILYNIWLVNHDEKFWTDPYEFNPSRFLDNTGNLVPPDDEKRQRIITFGLGRRACIGETLARLRIFIALVSVLQNFNLVPDPSHPLPDTDPRTFSSCDLLRAPRYKIVFQSRSI